MASLDVQTRVARDVFTSYVNFASSTLDGTIVDTSSVRGEALLVAIGKGLSGGDYWLMDEQIYRYLETT